MVIEGKWCGISKLTKIIGNEDLFNKSIELQDAIEELYSKVEDEKINGIQWAVWDMSVNILSAYYRIKSDLSLIFECWNINKDILNKIVLQAIKVFILELIEKMSKDTLLCIPCQLHLFCENCNFAKQYYRCMNENSLYQSFRRTLRLVRRIERTKLIKNLMVMKNEW